VLVKAVHKMLVKLTPDTLFDFSKQIEKIVEENCQKKSSFFFKKSFSKKIPFVYKDLQNAINSQNV